MKTIASITIFAILLLVQVGCDQGGHGSRTMKEGTPTPGQPQGTPTVPKDPNAPDIGG